MIGFDDSDEFIRELTEYLLSEGSVAPSRAESWEWNQPPTAEELANGRRYVECIGGDILSKESLLTLTDWERYLLPQAQQVEILGEIPLGEEDAQKLAQLFGQLFERHRLAESETIILRVHRAAFAMFLVMQGIYRFRAGDFWSGVGDAIGQDLDANWRSRLGQLFEANVRTLGLNPFLDFPVHAHRFVSRILGHGGIPNYCLDDFFNNMLRAAVTRDLYSEMSAEELIDEWLLRSSGRHYVDRPVLRFVEFGGQVALDFVERCREMAREFLDSGLVPRTEEIGLPPRVVEYFHDWAVERASLDPSQSKDNRDGRLRLRRPRILLDPWGEGLLLDLPPQQVPATLSQSEISWHARAGERKFDEVPVRIRRSGFDLQTNAESLPLHAPAEDYEVTLLLDGQAKRSWRYRGPDEERPLLAFDSRTGTLLRAGPSLPGRSLWLLYPSEAELEVTGEGVLLEEFPRLPWGWAEFRGQAWDLTRATGLAVHKGGKSFPIAIRPDEEAQRPRLVGGDPFDTSIAGSTATPLYVGTPPSARIPLVVRTRLLDELARWRLTLRSNWAAHPERNVTLPLSDLQPYLRQEDGCVELPLGVDSLLGDVPYGNFVLRLRGPLGRDAQLPLRIVPHLAITGHEPLYRPDRKKGPQPVTILVETEPETRIELQTEGTDDRLTAPTEGGHRRLHQIRAGPETTLLETNVVRFTPDASDEVRVPLTIPVHRLRWALQDGTTTTPLSERLNGQVIVYPVEALCQAEAPALMVAMPGIDATAIRATLHLQDVEDEILQEFGLTSSRREQVTWRFELGRFMDTVRHSDSPILRFVLRIRGLPDALDDVRVPLMRLTQSLMLEDIDVVPVIQEEQVQQVQVTWQVARPLRNRFIRFWPLWQPWQEPTRHSVPDEARGQFIIQMDPAAPQLHPAKYRLELGIDDPWSPPVQGERPQPGAQNTVDIAFVAPERRLQFIDRERRPQPPSFALHFESAIIQLELGHQDVVEKTLQWCYEHLDLATIPQILALVHHLQEIGSSDVLHATQLKMFAPKRVQTLLDVYRQAMIDDTQFQRYLSRVPRAELLPVQTARLLLDVPDSRIQSIALTRLVQLCEPPAVDAILSRCKSGTMSDADALALMATQEDFAVAELEKRADDPVALRLLGRLSDTAVIRVGTWVRSLAGWGRIRRIARLADEGEHDQGVDHFLRRETGYRLYVTLRPQHDAEPVTIEMHENLYRLHFGEGKRVYRCTKAASCCFVSRDHDLLYHYHNRAAHGGIGAQYRPEKRWLFRSTKPLQYSGRAPRDMLA